MNVADFGENRHKDVKTKMEPARFTTVTEPFVEDFIH